MQLKALLLRKHQVFSYFDIKGKYEDCMSLSFQSLILHLPETFIIISSKLSHSPKHRQKIKSKLILTRLANATTEQNQVKIKQR